MTIRWGGTRTVSTRAPVRGRRGHMGHKLAHENVSTRATRGGDRAGIQARPASARFNPRLRDGATR